MTLDRWSRRTFSFSKLATGVLLALAMAPALAEAQGTVNFQVTNLNDSGPGSLREAIEDANASNADTKIITFDVVNDGTINLLTDLPEISPDGVTIDGSTAVNLSINAGGVTTQILDLGDDTSTTTVTDIALSGGPIKIGSGASMSFDVSADQQFDNVIADAQTDDAGRLIKEGAATLTLGGANTYTGGTLVRAGTLRGDTTSLQGDIAVDGGAVVEFNQTDDDSFDGAITGQGAVLKTGAAELELTGANTYAGNTTISAGSLRGDAGSLQGNISVANNAAVIFEHDNDDEYSGDLTGAGGFTKEGAGTLTLSGANTISGASSLDGGALIGGAASIPRNLTTAAGTSVTFDDGENDGTYSGSLKGAGDFVKLGTGTLTLSGTNTISGPASLDEGALRGGPAGIPANLATAAGTSVIFNHANNGTYAGAISGSADVTKSGSGALTLSGANTFTGLTSLTGGRLYVEGSLVGGVDVAAGTVLGGTGSIGGPVDVNGTVAPGNSIGELTVDSVVFAPGSVFAVEVAESGAGDRLTVLGNADLAGGSVTVDPGAGSYLAPVDVTILSAASINGDFASFGPDFAFLDITHITDATSVVLTIQRNAMGLAEYAETPNQSTIAAALEAARLAGTDPDIETVFESLDVLTVNQVPGVLNAMTGETLTQFATARLATAQRFGRSLDARIREYQWDNKSALIGGSAAAGAASELAAASGRDQSAPIFGVAMLGVGPMGAPRTGTTVKPDPLLRAWIDGSGIYGDVDGNSNESAFDYTIWGGSLGADLRLAEHWVLGIAGGYANTDLDFSDRPGEGDIDTFQGALYAGYVDPKFHLGVSGRYAYNDMDGNREIGFGLNRKASADIDGDDYGARFESGLNLLDLGGFVFQPMASVDYNRLDQDSFTEGGAGSLNLAVEDNDLDSLVLGVGMRVHGSWQVDDGLWIVPELTGRWLHEFLDTDRQIEARLVSNLAASAFQIQGVELPRDSGSVGVAWNVITDSAWSVIGSYDAILNADLVQHVGSITISFEF